MDWLMEKQNVVIAVIIPCYQEEKTIASVVEDFRRELPAAEIYVYDNNSTDSTAQLALAAGAIVRHEKRQGKGFVVSSMLSDISADIFVLVDGDGTYCAADVHKLLDPVLSDRADMVIASRQETFAPRAFPRFHQWGNRMVCWLVNATFGSNIRDIFSGYRAFTRQLAMEVPITARGFDLETELTVQSLYRGFILFETESRYGVRPPGSSSKLKTVRDGSAVLLKFLGIAKSYKPLFVFGAAGILTALASLGCALRPALEQASSGAVESFGLALAAAVLMILSFTLAAVGLILHSINLRQLETESLVSRRLAASENSPSRS